MLRTVKTAKERKNEILDAADELFAEKGFDGTTTEDILERVGIARGTLYYHFKSKAAIMDALIERYKDTLLTKAKEIAANQTIPIPERIGQVILSLNLSGGSSEEIMKHIHQPQNALMHQKIQQIVIHGLTPIITGIVHEGIEQEVFNPPYPYEAVEMLVTYMIVITDDEMSGLKPEDTTSKIQAFIFHAEKLLGAQKGSLSYLMEIFTQ